MKLILLSAIVLNVLTVTAQPIRKAAMGGILKPTPEGLRVDSVIKGGTLSELGLQKNDVITGINGRDIKTIESYAKTTSSLRSGDAVEVKYLQDGKQTSANGKAIMRAYEKHEFADVIYDWVKFREGALRAITRKPKGQSNLPAILLIPGYGCGSIESYMNSYNGKLINEWLKAGYAVITVEKSGLGDSYGCIPCSEADLATDIQSFDAAYRYMESLDYVDRSRLYIWGHSMGGVIAPEVAKLHNPKGVMVFGTTFRPWSEFLLEMHRVQKPLLDKLDYQQTESFMRTIQKIYYEFFVLKKSREELLANPEYRELVISELGYKENNNDMWGRHWAFWPQIDSLNLAQSWKEVKCPVLVVHGETDYESCSIVEPTLITQTVNASNPGNGTMKIVPELDHFMMNSKSYEAARDNFRSQQYNKGNFNQRLATETISWLKSH